MKVADGVDVRIAERTNYPFEETVAFRIEEMARPGAVPLYGAYPFVEREYGDPAQR